MDSVPHPDPLSGPWARSKAASEDEIDCPVCVCKRKAGYKSIMIIK